MQPIQTVQDSDLSPVPLLEKYMSQAKAYSPFVDAYTGLIQDLTRGRSLTDVVADMTGTRF